MPEYDFETYPTTPDAMAKYLQEREAAGNPMTGEEALAYSDWSRERGRAIQAKIDARKTPEEREEFRRFSYIADIAAVRVSGEGVAGYATGTRALIAVITGTDQD